VLRFPHERLPYDSATPATVIAAIERNSEATAALGRQWPHGNINISVVCQQVKEPPKIERRLFHAVERHEEPMNADFRRKVAARSSWDALYNEKGVVPCHFWKYPRTALDIGDSRALPYIKDVLANAMNQAMDDDVIFWTNDDNWIHPELPDKLLLQVALHGCCCSQRCEFKTPIPNAVQPVDFYARMGMNHMGRDLFAFTKRWLADKWDEVPDFILGASDFDLALAAMIRLEFGIESTRANMETAIPPAELDRGYVSHVYHPPHWMKPGYVDSAPAQKHNRLLWRIWATNHLPNLRFTVNNTI
jgi:hypothetical protein